jgi:hypothetical protein
MENHELLLAGRTARISYFKKEWGEGLVGIGCGAAAATSAWEQSPVKLTGGTHGLLPSLQSPCFRWVLCWFWFSVQKELAQCLLPGEIRNQKQNPHGVFEQVGLESHRRVDRLLPAKEGNIASIAWSQGNIAYGWPGRRTSKSCQIKISLLE